MVVKGIVMEPPPVPPVGMGCRKVERVSTGSAKEECKGAMLWRTAVVGWRTKASETPSRAARRRGEVYRLLWFIMMLVVG
jgi:hypothetical protein